jgi:hypothetical protein
LRGEFAPLSRLLPRPAIGDEGEWVKEIQTEKKKKQVSKSVSKEESKNGKQEDSKKEK